MTDRFNELVTVIGNGCGRHTFLAVIDELTKLSNGEGMLALRAVSTAQVAGILVGERSVMAVRLIRAHKESFPAEQQREVVTSLLKDWEHLSDEDLDEVLSTLDRLRVECSMDLSFVKFELSRLADARPSLRASIMASRA